MKTVIAIICLVMAMSLQAQNTALINAFSKSYASEQYQNYTQAIDDLMGNYEAASYETNLRLGWLTYLTGDYSKSKNYYKKAIQLESKSIEARLGLVYPLAAVEDWDAVIEQYKQILVIDPNHSLVNYRLAYIYFSRKNYKVAETYANKTLQQYPFDYDTVILLAQIHTSLGNISQAKKMYERALLYSPTDQTAKDGFAKLK